MSELSVVEIPTFTPDSAAATAAPEAPPATTDQPVDTGTTTESVATEPEAAAPSEPSLKERLAAAIAAGELDPKELIKDIPKLQGHVGSLADELERRRSAERETAAERQRRLDIAKADPEHPASQLILKEAEQAQQTQSRDLIQTETLVGMKEAFQGLLRTLPKAEQEAHDAAVAGKDYGNTPTNNWSTNPAYYLDAITAIAKARADAERPALEAAIRKELLAELNGGEETRPALTNGQTPSSNAWTAERYTSYLNTPFEKRAPLSPADEKDIDAMMALLRR